MTKRGTIILTAVLAAGAVLLLGRPAAAQTARQVSLYADVKARGVGDIVTVAIVERSSGSNTSKLTTSKSTKFTADGQEGTGALDFIPDLGMSTQFGRDHSGTGQGSREGRLTATLAATVTEVLPNGDLVIEGEREVGVNDEHEILSLRGTVRPADISSGNVVYSSNIANAEIEYKGKGSVTGGSQPNIFVRILSWFF
jgi:flagellar L-ring protein precursor FlgH